MTTEQKAKAYDEAIARACNIAHTSDIAKIEDIFPELKGNEDEKIIKKVISVLTLDIEGAESQMRANPRVDRTFEVYACNKVINWLKGKKLPHVTDRETLDEYAYQCAYDLSNDWAIDNPTWEDVETACKLGAKWAESRKSIEWSEEDKTRLANIIIMLKEGASHHFSEADISKSVDWLKSFKQKFIEK